MSFTYDIASRDLVSQVRNLIQDIDPDDYDMEDEDIEYLLEEANDDVVEAGKMASFRLATKYSKEASKVEVDGVRTEFQNRASNYYTIYEELKSIAIKASYTKGIKAPIVMGGVDRKTYNKHRDDRTLVKPAFTEQQTEYNQDFPELSPIDKPFWGGCL